MTVSAIDNILYPMTEMLGETPRQTERTVAELEAIQFGIDIDLIEYNLGLSHEERIHQHEAALALVRELVKAREALHPRS